MWSIVHHGGGLQALVGKSKLGFKIGTFDMAWGFLYLQQCSYKGVDDLVEYDALEDRWNLWRLVMD
jgi:hypothetical protein